MVRAAYPKIKNSAELPSPKGVALRARRIAQNENSGVDQIGAAGAIFSVSTRQVPPLDEIHARVQECLTRIDLPGPGELGLHSEQEGMNVGR